MHVRKRHNNNHTATPMECSSSNWSRVTFTVAAPPATFTSSLSVKILPSSSLLPSSTRVTLIPGGLLHGRTVTLYSVVARGVVLMHRRVSQSVFPLVVFPLVVQLAESISLAMSRSTSQVVSSSSLSSQFTAKQRGARWRQVKCANVRD